MTPSFEGLEDRLVLATLSDGGTSTLTISLVANESVIVSPNATTYSISSSQNFVNGGVSSAGDFGGLGSTFLTLQASGITRYSTIKFIDAGAGASVRLDPNGTNAFSTSIQAQFTRGPAAPGLWVTGAKFTGSAGLSANMNGAFYVTGPLSTASGGISITASSAATHAVQLDPGGSITSTSGSISLQGTCSSNDAGSTGLIIGGNVTISTGGAGTVTLQGSNTGGGAGLANNAAGVQITTASGDIGLTGIAAASHGLYLLGANVSTTGGPISMMGSTSSGVSGHRGMLLDVGTIISAGGSGPVTLQGSSTGAGTGLETSPNVQIISVSGTINLTGNATQSHGLVLYGDQTQVTSSTGAINLNGTTTSLNSNHYATYVTSGAKVKADGAAASATIMVQGTTSGIGAGVVINTGSKVMSNRGDVTLNGSCTNATNASSGTGIVVAGLNTQVSSSSGSLSLTGSSAMTISEAVGVIIYDSASVGTSGVSASVSVQGTSTGTGRGVQVSSGGQVSSAGTILVTGAGTYRAVSLDIDHGGPGGVLSGTGSITVQGTSSAAEGVLIYGTGSQVVSSSGPVSITGQSTGTGANSSIGIRIEQSAQVKALGASSTATLSLNGSSAGNREGVNVSAGSQATSAAGALGLMGMSGGGTGFYIGGANTLLRSAAAITISGTSTSGVGGSVESGALVSSTFMGSNAPNVQISGTTASTDYPALAINRDGMVTTVSSPILLTGTQTAASPYRAAMEVAGGLVKSTGTGANAGSITIQGTSANGGIAASFLFDSNTNHPARVSTVDGAVSISGTGAPMGVRVEGSSELTGTGTGAFTLTATQSALSIDHSSVTSVAAIALNTTSSPSRPNDLSVVNGSTLSSATSSITLASSDNVLLDASSTMTASGALTVTCMNDNGLPLGVGARVDMLGQVAGSPVTLRENSLPIPGSSPPRYSPSGFKVAPSMSSVLNVIGRPTPNPAVPNGLSILTPMGQTSTLNTTTSTSGFYTTTGGFQNVTYTGMPPLQSLDLVVTRGDDLDPRAPVPGPATFDVNSVNLSPRQAVALANVSPGADTIRFSPSLNGQTLTLTQGPLILTAPYADETTTINGAGQVTISGGSSSEIIATLLGVPLNLTQLSLINGMANAGGYSGGYGGAVTARGPLSVNQCVFTNNQAEFGGGSVYYEGPGFTLSITGTTFQENSAGDGYTTGGAIYLTSGTAMINQSMFTNNTAGYGGALVNYDGMTVDQCAFSGNTAIVTSASNGGGGAIYNSGTLLNVRASTFSGNQAGTDGGGAIVSYYTPTTIVNSTFSGNSSTGSGGAIYAYGGSLATRDNTIVLNRADTEGGGSALGGGIAVVSGADVLLFNTIVAGNTVGAPGSTTANDVDGTANSTSANNLIGDTATSGGLMNGTQGNIVGVNGSGTRPIGSIINTTLADNGGPTFTHALASNSPALTAGNTAQALDLDGATPLQFDQRGLGFNRVVSGLLDIGSYQNQTPPSFVTVSSAGVSWGTRSSGPLATQGDGMRLLPAGRSMSIPWMGIQTITITLSGPATLAPGDVSVTGINTRSYGPVMISGGGASWTITLVQPITDADRVTVMIGNSGITSYTRRLDVLPGDVTDDGFVNAQDLAMLGLAAGGGGVPFPLVMFDLNGDNLIDNADYRLIRQRIGQRLP